MGDGTIYNAGYKGPSQLASSLSTEGGEPQAPPNKQVSMFT